MLDSSHLVSLVDVVYVHSLNPLLMLPLIYHPSLHLTPPMPEHGMVGTVPAAYHAQGEERTCEHWFFHLHSEQFPNNLL